jgi:hypothetical protein
MAVIRRHWVMSLTIVLVLAGGGGWLAFSHFGQAKADDPPETPESPTGGQEPAANTVDPDTYCRVRELRERLCLRNEDLAAMGCTQAQAESVLEGLLNWYKTNKANLAAAAKTKGDARRTLRRAFAKIHMGPRDEAVIAQMPALKKAVADTAITELNTVRAAVPTIDPLLSAEQKTLWSTVRANAGAPRVYRYAPGLTAQQAQVLEIALRARARRLRVVTGTTERQAAETALVSEESRALTEAQRTAIASAGTAIGQGKSAMAAASQEVLPLPEEMKPRKRKLPKRPTRSTTGS